VCVCVDDLRGLKIALNNHRAQAKL
jgi:hypothetical protein